MCIPQRIPLPVTVLYVITVVNLTVLLNLTLVDANVIVCTKTNRTLEDSILDLPAQFGPAIPSRGVWGHLMYVVPHDACLKVKAPPKDIENATGIGNRWIALIRRNGCNFDTKVLNVQKAGFVAAIIHNVGSDKLISMGGKSNASKVDIPAVFIGSGDAQYLSSNFDDNTHYSIVIDKQTPFIDPGTAKMIFAIFGIVIGSCFVTMIAFAVVKWVRDIRRRRRSRLSKQHLKKLPIKKFKKGDTYDVCAICLDEYEEGNKLRILPCDHAYHVKCIDPWLTKNKKTCPICKRKVIPGHNSDSSESESDSDGGTTTGMEASGESEPLLSSHPSVRGGNTFDNSGLPERYRGLHFASSSDSSSDESMVAFPATYQSSVEVHSEPDYRRSRVRPPRRIGRPGSARYALMDETKEGSGVDEGNQETGRDGSKKCSSPPIRAWEYGVTPTDDITDHLQGAMAPAGQEDDSSLLGAVGGVPEVAVATAGVKKSFQKEKQEPESKPKSKSPSRSKEGHSDKSGAENASLDGNHRDSDSNDRVLGNTGDGEAMQTDGSASGEKSNSEEAVTGAEGGSDTAHLLEQPDVEIVHSRKGGARKKLPKKKRKSDRKT